MRYMRYNDIKEDLKFFNTGVTHVTHVTHVKFSWIIRTVIPLI